MTHTVIKGGKAASMSDDQLTVPICLPGLPAGLHPVWAAADQDRRFGGYPRHRVRQYRRHQRSAHRAKGSRRRHPGVGRSEGCRGRADRTGAVCTIRTPPCWPASPRFWDICFRSGCASRAARASPRALGCWSRPLGRSAWPPAPCGCSSRASRAFHRWRRWRPSALPPSRRWFWKNSASLSFRLPLPCWCSSATRPISAAARRDRTTYRRKQDGTRLSRPARSPAGGTEGRRLHGRMDRPD